MFRGDPSSFETVLSEELLGSKWLAALGAGLPQWASTVLA